MSTKRKKREYDSTSTITVLAAAVACRGRREKSTCSIYYMSWLNDCFWRKKSREKVCCLCVRWWCAATRILDTSIVAFVYSSTLIFIYTLCRARFFLTIYCTYIHHIIYAPQDYDCLFSLISFAHTHTHFSTWRSGGIFQQRFILSFFFSPVINMIQIFFILFFDPFFNVLIVWISISKNQIDASKPLDLIAGSIREYAYFSVCLSICVMCVYIGVSLCLTYVNTNTYENHPQVEHSLAGIKVIQFHL